MALSKIGEDTIVYSNESDYAANIEKAEVVYQPQRQEESSADLTKIETPNVKTAQELADFLQLPLNAIVKSMIFKIDGEFVMILIRGHHELNDVKLKSYFGTDAIEMATEDEIVNLVGAHPGSLGPILIKISK